MKPRTTRVEVDEQGHLILPPEIMRRYGLVPGARLRMEEGDTGLTLLRTPAVLSRVYVEPTNLCNLDCRTCMRHVWDEALGTMEADTFARILHGVKQFLPIPTIFFGGFGEPLAHPQILEMISAAKGIGAEVELITNGILLTEEVARRMIAVGLDRLWVSIDGATPQSYADVRLGDALPQVLANLACLQDLRAQSGASAPCLGIACVAMKRNLADLPEIIRTGKRLGADRFSISNVLPHTPELQEQILYTHSLSDGNLQSSALDALVSLPRTDLDLPMLEIMSAILKDRNQLHLAGQDLKMGLNTCPFITKGSISIRWDGAVSPCLPLLHSHESYLGDTLHKSHAFSLGNIQQRGLAEIWQDPAYLKQRERLHDFDFSPCTFCNSCDMAQANKEDCYGNVQPACGGCLWAQGFIQCP
ncbi:MAG TPA: radical SAM protein [Anaerolineaceae bacterium]|nr:radical SAM protein [Anaerolineaceae bacterium]